MFDPFIQHYFAKHNLSTGLSADVKSLGFSGVVLRLYLNFWGFHIVDVNKNTTVPFKQY